MAAKVVHSRILPVMGGVIDYVDHETEACGAAKITYADTVITKCESDPSLGSYTDNEEADVPETKKLSF